MDVQNRINEIRNEIAITDVEGLMPKNHLLRKAEKAIDWNRIYDILEPYYCKDNGRPCCDPVVLVKMVFIQHIYGIKSLRQTVQDSEVNIAYRWFLGLGFYSVIPHFSTISYAFRHRFTAETIEEIFTLILERAYQKGYLRTDNIFIDSTHIKANANKKKFSRLAAEQQAKVYADELRREIDEDREEHDKKPLKDNDDDENPPIKEVKVSTVDPDCGVFHKGEHKIEMAYLAHTACDKNNFILDFELTAANVHDSTVFDKVYDKVTKRFDNIEIVAVDAGYKTPWICKKIIDDGRIPSMPYKRPMEKTGFFRPHEYVYDEYYDCIICPENQILKYSTTNRDGYKEFKSDPDICRNCPSRGKCTNSKNFQKVFNRHVWQDYLDFAEDVRHSPIGKESYALRSQTIERVFADAKEKHAMRYTFYRGLSQVTNWVRLKYAAMNLKKLAVWAW